MLRRNKKGTRSVDLWAWNVEDFSSMQGPLAVQEYIQELIRNDPSNVKKIIEPPEEVDINVWQYEHMRQFILELNLLVTQLNGVCTPQSCPKMKANDWLYLCAAHKKEQECCAIDYMTHNLDLATSILQNVKNFSSRVSIPDSAIKNIGTIVRRLYRLFSHCYYNHKEIFLEFENEMFLCARFTEFAARFDLMPTKLFNIPAEVLKNSEM
jgi:Mob1/phocein family.